MNGFKDKLASGRFILTIVAAICFILMTIAFCTLLILKVDDIAIGEVFPYISSIILVTSNIFTFYFTKRLTGDVNESRS